MSLGIPRTILRNSSLRSVSINYLLFTYFLFIQAVITVNLTSMLVLTTMFINVSNNLPKTSYMKMMDVWLLFNLLYPFIVVLLHTYMDTLRNDEEREINHHGRAIAVDENKSDSGLQIKVLDKQNVDIDP